MKLCIILSCVLAFSSLSNAAISITADSLAVTGPDPYILSTTEATTLTFQLGLANDDTENAVAITAFNLVLATDDTLTTKSENFEVLNRPPTVEAGATGEPVTADLTADVTVDAENCDDYTKLCVTVNSDDIKQCIDLSAENKNCAAAAATTAQPAGGSTATPESSSAGLTVSVYLTVFMAFFALLSLNM